MIVALNYKHFELDPWTNKGSGEVKQNWGYVLQVPESSLIAVLLKLHQLKGGDAAHNSQRKDVQCGGWCVKITKKGLESDVLSEQEPKQKLIKDEWDAQVLCTTSYKIFFHSWVRLQISRCLVPAKPPNTYWRKESQVHAMRSGTKKKAE